MRTNNTQRQRGLQGRLRNLGQSLSMYRYGRRGGSASLGDRWATYDSPRFPHCHCGGFLPAAIAYVGKLIVDAVVQAAQSGEPADRWTALSYLGIEAILVAILAAANQGLSLCQSLLRALLGQKGKSAHS